MRNAKETPTTFALFMTLDYLVYSHVYNLDTFPQLTGVSRIPTAKSSDL